MMIEITEVFPTPQEYIILREQAGLSAKPLWTRLILGWMRALMFP
ncbi:hypothetical protein [Xenorhabdus beddingii]|nr:hypothetical protein [Xenorhabdus beddingii]